MEGPLIQEGRSFATGRVEPVIDEAEEPDSSDVERALDLFRELASVAESDVEIPDETSDVRESPNLELAPVTAKSTMRPSASTGFPRLAARTNEAAPLRTPKAICAPIASAA